MARRLEGQKYALGYNSGVYVVAPIYSVTASHKRCTRTPIFCFVRKERQEREGHFTGDLDFYHHLLRFIEEEGGEIVGRTGIHVPFSGPPPSLSEESRRQYERERRRFATTADDFIEIFRITQHDFQVWREEMGHREEASHDS